MEKKEITEAIEMNDINLFEYLPFNQDNIEKFCTYYNNIVKHAQTLKMPRVIQNHSFLKQNEDGETFINILLNYEKPSSYEKIAFRTILLRQFSDSFEFNKIPQSFQDNLIFSKKFHTKDPLKQSMHNVIFEASLYKFLSSLYNSFQMKDITYFQEELSISLTNEDITKTNIIMKEYISQFASLTSPNNSLAYETAFFLLPSLFHTTSYLESSKAILCNAFYEQFTELFPTKFCQDMFKNILSFQEIQTRYDVLSANTSKKEDLSLVKRNKI